MLAQLAHGFLLFPQLFDTAAKALCRLLESGDLLPDRFLPFLRLLE